LNGTIVRRRKGRVCDFGYRQRT